jgi:hypothetical protein
MKLKNGIEIVSMNELSGIGRVRMRSPFTAPDIRASEKLAEKLT